MVGNVLGVVLLLLIIITMLDEDLDEDLDVLPSVVVLVDQDAPLDNVDRDDLLRRNAKDQDDHPILNDSNKVVAVVAVIRKFVADLDDHLANAKNYHYPVVEVSPVRAVTVKVPIQRSQVRNENMLKRNPLQLLK